MVASQKMTSSGRMQLKLDCTQAAADQMAECHLGPRRRPGAVGGNTLTPTQIPIAPGAGARRLAAAG